MYVCEFSKTKSNSDYKIEDEVDMTTDINLFINRKLRDRIPTGVVYFGGWHVSGTQAYNWQMLVYD
jgi:hypothetical protein